MFTKEHYTAVAKVLRRTVRYSIDRFDAVGSHLAHKTVDALVELFRENPKFDKEKFLDAIYGKEEGK